MHAGWRGAQRFQQADKVSAYEACPAGDVGGAVVSLLLMLHFDLLISLVTLLIVVSVMLRNHVGETDPLAEQHYKTQGRRQGVLAESVAGIITVKALAREHSAVRTMERCYRCGHRGDAAAIRRSAASTLAHSWSCAAST
jgi:ABC-type multidrug transport system fused ATPase/permease subunit